MLLRSASCTIEYQTHNTSAGMAQGSTRSRNITLLLFLLCFPCIAMPRLRPCLRSWVSMGAA